MTQKNNHPKFHASPEKIKPLKAMRYWLVQGMLYAHPTERIFKIAMELLFFVPSFLFLRSLGLGAIASVLVAFFVSHNINFLLNCALWETLICDLTFRGAGRKTLFRYVKELRSRLARHDSILCAFIYGSISRGALHDSSDLDLVIVRRQGFRNAMFSLAVLTFEKLRALVYRIPLESYLADDLSFLDRPRNDETPLVVADTDGVLRSAERPLQTIEDAEEQNGMVVMQ